MHHPWPLRPTKGCLHRFQPVVLHPHPVFRRSKTRPPQPVSRRSPDHPPRTRRTRLRSLGAFRLTPPPSPGELGLHPLHTTAVTSATAGKVDHFVLISISL